MNEDVSGTLLPAKPQGKLVGGAAGRAEKNAKWPTEVQGVNGKTVFQGYRQLILADRRFRFFWRSRKGVGFWVTAKDAPVFSGKTLTEATLKLADWAMHEINTIGSLLERRFGGSGCGQRVESDASAVIAGLGESAGVIW